MLPELKPYLTALALPPASLLAIILIGALLVTSKPRLARRLVLLAATSLWLLSTSACSVWLHSQFVPNYPLITAKDLRSNSAQAVVVLGGGVVTGLPSGDQQMSRTSLERLRLGVQLSRQAGLPLAFSGGSGWGAKDANVFEADVAERVLLEAFAFNLKFKESHSRDTQENATNTWALLSKQEIRSVALVTHSTHMPRASAEFKKAGFVVIEAATGQPTASSATLLQWAPSASSLEMSQQILRELLAQTIQKFRGN
jgi:uncharacterized SAM-binding protein YcdF (DUF218 family)